MKADYHFITLINSSNYSFNTEVSAESRQIHILSNYIPDLEKREKSFNEEKKLLRNKLQGHQQRYNNFFSLFRA